MFNVSLLSLVQMDLDQTRAVQLDADPLANNFSWEAQIVQNGILHMGQSTTEMKMKRGMINK